MLIWVLAAALLCLLAASYELEGQSLLAPSVLFSGGFAASALCGALMSGIWQVELHFGAFALVLVGVSLFCATSAITGRLLRRRYVGGAYGIAPIDADATYKKLWHYSELAMMLLCLIAVVTTVWTFLKITEAFPEGSVGDAIKAYDTAKKRTTTSVAFGTPLNQMKSFCVSAGFYVACVLGAEIERGRFKKLSFYTTVLAFIALFFFSMATGGRTTCIGYVFCTFLTFVILRIHSHQGDMRKLKRRIIIVAIAIVVVIIVLFQFLALGRTVKGPLVNYIGLYLGGQIFNLDHFMQYAPAHKVKVWGGMTLFTTFSNLGDKLHVSEFTYVLDHPFLRSTTDLAMGNVYTTFYAFYYDFGFAGVLLFVPIMAIVAQFFYQKAMTAQASPRWDLWITLYGFVAYQLVLCFFSNKMYENVITVAFVRFVVYLIAARVFLIVFTPERLKPALSGVGAKLRDAGRTFKSLWS